MGAGDPSGSDTDYKLKMGVRLGRLGRLSTWWRTDLSVRLAAVSSGRAIWNLLPSEHAAAWRAPDGALQWSVRFLEPGRDGSLTAVSHWNKLLKGALVRFLVANPAAGPDELAGWEHPMGFRYDPTRDTEDAGITMLTFVKMA